MSNRGTYIHLDFLEFFSLGERKVQLVDISLGGAAFIYRGSPTELEAAGFLKMFAQTPNAGRKLDGRE